MTSTPAPTEVVERVGPKRAQPPTVAQDVTCRRAVTLAFWAVALLGVPYWWSTTTIERLPLPTADILTWSHRAPCYLRPSVSLRVQSPNPSLDVKTSTLSIRSRVEAQSGCINLKAAAAFDATPGVTEYQVVLKPGKEGSLGMSGRTACIGGESKEEAVEELVSTLLDLGHDEPDQRVVKFAPRYTVVFSLMNEDSTKGAALLEWEIESLLQTHLKPLLASLEPLHSFIVETRIQYFAPLSINVAKGDSGTVVEEADLGAFVNSAEWNIGSPVTLDPVLHFILYVPSPENRPMRIRTSSGSTDSSNAFITPQWGGVVIYNPPSSPASADLSPSFNLFTTQLHTLLGVPPSPFPTSTSLLAAWQVDALIRRRLAEATKETIDTLQAIVTLVRDIPNMRVGPAVQRGVQNSLASLARADLALTIASPAEALRHVARASELASKAYFDPTMLALLYFPDEHKYAVYTPLFAPVAVPMVAALFREFKAWKAGRG